MPSSPRSRRDPVLTGAGRKARKGSAGSGPHTKARPAARRKAGGDDGKKAAVPGGNGSTDSLNVADAAGSGKVDDVGLLHRCADGDAEAWELFDERYGRFLDWLVRRALSRVGAINRAQEADIDDLRASLVTALLERDGQVLRRFDGRAAVTTYLAVVGMRHLGRDLRRRYNPSITPMTSPIDGLLEEIVADHRDHARPEQPLEAAERVTSVEAAMSRLPERDALLLRLAYEEELPYETIAGVLDVAVNSIGPLLQRARARFERTYTGP